MDIIGFAIPFFFAIIIISLFLSIISSLFFYLKMTEKIKTELKKYGYEALYGQFEDLENSVGKLRPRGWSQKGKKFDKIWLKFRKVEFTEDDGSLLKMQKKYKFLIYFHKFSLVLILLPFIVIVIYLFISLVRYN